MILTDDLRARLANRVQLTTDGYRPYLEAVEGTFGVDVDYAQLVKLYGAEGSKGPEAHYSPAECTGIRKHRVEGNPDIVHVSTSHVERMNLSIRMQNRRFTRLTNGFSKKLDNYIHALALYVTFYNFCRIHKSLRVTPAMAAGITDHLWSLNDIVAKIDEMAPARLSRAVPIESAAQIETDTLPDGGKPAAPFRHARVMAEIDSVKPISFLAFDQLPHFEEPF